MRFFGNPSAGMTTANEVYPLRDGAWLVLTVSTYVDRTGRVYGGQIMPEDTAVISPGSVDNRIKEWLLSQPSCSTP